MLRLIIIFILLLSINFSAQEKKDNYSYFQTSYLSGNILRHNKNVGHFLNDHPKGFLLSWNKKSFGKQDWEHRYNYPDFGYSFAYQDYKNDILGELYSIYAHYNFYLLPRTNKNQLVLRGGWGLAYNTNPYDKETNPKNVAFGTHINSSTYFNLYYQREHLFDKIGLNAGLTIIHSSNSSVKSPNTGINVWAATIGLNYNLEDSTELKFIPSEEEKKYKEKIKYNFVFRTGANETDVINSGVKPFFIFSAYADKRLNRKSAIQFGGDLFLIYSMKEYIELSEIVNSEFKKGDWKRGGLFIGHELFINKISIISQLGYYVYYPVVFEGRIYQRIGLKRYFNNWFATVSLKAHAAKAETVSFGVGIRL